MRRSNLPLIAVKRHIYTQRGERVEFSVEVRPEQIEDGKQRQKIQRVVKRLEKRMDKWATHKRRMYRMENRQREVRGKVKVLRNTLRMLEDKSVAVTVSTFDGVAYRELGKLMTMNIWSVPRIY